MKVPQSPLYSIDLLVQNATNCSTDGSYADIRSDEVVTSEMADFISHNSGGMVRVSRVQYQDTQGAFYDSDTCAYRLETGAIATCQSHNEIHRHQS